MKIPSCPLPVWKNLYDAALAFRDIEPWEWMSDTDVFGVQNPENGEIGYCCVLGELGEVLGLVAYLGTKGLEQHRNIQSGKLHAGSPEFIYSQHCLTAWFGDRNELEQTDLKVVKQLGLKFHGSNAWPQFRTFQPGYYPWHLTESEARYLTMCLEQARHIALCLENDPDWLSAPNKNHYLIRIAVDDPSQSGKAHENFVNAQPADSNSSMGQQLLFKTFDEPHGRQWKDQWLKPAPLTRARVRPCSIDEVSLQRIKNTSQAQYGIWEVDAFYTPHLLTVTTGLSSRTHTCVPIMSRGFFSTPSWLNHRRGNRNFAKLFLRASKPTSSFQTFCACGKKNYVRCLNLWQPGLASKYD
jgi:hypothetical protein